MPDLQRSQRSSARTDALDDRIDLMAPPLALALLRRIHHAVLDAMEESRALRIRQHDLDVVFVRFETPRDARDRPRRARARHESIDPTFDLRPDLWPGAMQVRLVVGQALELIGEEPASATSGRDD